MYANQSTNRIYYITEYVDIETGEMYKFVKGKTKHKIINKIEKFEKNGEYTIKRTTNICRRYSEQAKLQFEENR